ncbi:MAG: hypothetical protein AMXMBFR47_36110 [Planctomycetota bacterium]
MWNGSSTSGVSLAPPGSRNSQALGIYRDLQVGYATVGVNGPYHAGLWRGSAESWIELHPPEATESKALGVGNGLQVGYAKIGGIDHAFLWRGSVESRVDLTPEATTYSSANAAFAGVQAGTANRRASVWHGSAGSKEDLHASLPVTFTESYGYGVWGTSRFIYVVGYGSDRGATHEAVLWRRPNPCPTDLDGDGKVGLSDLSIVLGHFGRSTEITHADGDMNDDGLIGTYDLSRVLQDFGSACVQ